MGTGISGWYARHQAPVDAAGIAGITVLAASLGVRALWDVFSVLPAEPDPWWGLVTALPGCLLILGKLRAPMAMLVLGSVLWLIDLVTVGSLGTMVMLMDLLWNATRRADQRGRRRILVTVVIGVAALVLIGGVRSGNVQLAVMLALGLGSLFGVTFATAMSLGQAHELADLQARLRREDQARARVELESQRASDRRAMARELHDLVAGHVSAAALRAEAALVADTDLDGARTALRSVRGASLDAHAALRRMIDVLADPAAAPESGARELASVIGAARDQGLTVTADIAAAPALPESAGRALARVVRESLTNASRYAGAGIVEVDVTADVDFARVRVVSPLAAEPVPRLPGGGWGLRSLDQDVRALGGDFRAGAQGESWVVEASVPCAAVAAEES
ncbi:sensor histidine kinase [Microbacterium nymphoidis]|uniref:sensor histidine kinase n=1 Tax=Microbacterium nymphoidis TaxID=2898586 RepID=UPI001E562AED|nr:histidine kinase [Microbacterium nymphoidis]MCD2498335.1 histidine kinase [Microbacterium nymphoidis]